MTAEYQARAAAHAIERDRWQRRSTGISRLRLATFIPGALLLVYALGRGLPALPLAAALLLLALFAALVVWHAGVDARADWYDALHTVNRHALARIGRAWDNLPAADPPPSLDIEHHPYAHDLDLFGRASLMQWLGPAATAPGIAVVQQWLLHPADPATVRGRQAAVAALAPELEWRERLGAHGRLAASVRPAELARFLDWVEGAGGFTPARTRALFPVVLGLTASIWLLGAAHALGWTDGAFWLIPMVAGMMLSFATAASVHGQFSRAGAGQQAWARYANLLAHAAAAPAGTPHLAAVKSRLTAAGEPAPHSMRRFNRILGCAELRLGAGILHFPIHALTLWDFHVYFALDRWRRRAAPHVRDWMQALGELDALSAFAQIAADNPHWAVPDLVAGAGHDEAAATPALIATNLGHPLLGDDRRVGNDVQVGPAGTLLLITGSNMSGKSTLLRAIGLNTVLAQAGAPVCANSLQLPPVDLETSIRVQDSLEHGLSYFMAALARLKGVVDRADRAAATPGSRPVLYLLDEILQGTNTAERAVAVRGLARHLLQAGAIGVMTTHDLGVASEEPLDRAARLVHFTETVNADGAMSFDYRLRPGLATSRNALRLMRLIGIDVERSMPESSSAG